MRGCSGGYSQTFTAVMTQDGNTDNLLNNTVSMKVCLPVNGELLERPHDGV
jgi:hypothetical protein